MTNLPPEIIERMRIHRSQSIDEDGPYEFGDHDFENDALTIIDAYLAENDPTPIDKSWLVSIGGEVYHHNESIITVLMPTPDDTWLGIQVEWNPAYPEVIPSLNAVQDKKAQNAQETVGMLVPTRGTFRTAMRVLGIKIEEPNP